MRIMEREAQQTHICLKAIKGLHYHQSDKRSLVKSLAKMNLANNEREEKQAQIERAA